MKNSTLLLLIVLLITSCSENKNAIENEQDIISNILTTYNEMYTSYGQGTDEFFKYFEND